MAKAKRKVTKRETRKPTSGQPRVSSKVRNEYLDSLLRMQELCPLVDSVFVIEMKKLVDGWVAKAERKLAK